MRKPPLTNRVMRGLLLLTARKPSVLALAILGGILDPRKVLGVDKKQIEDVSRAITWIHKMSDYQRNKEI